MCFRVNLLLPPWCLTPLSHGEAALLLLFICTLFCHSFRWCSDISIFFMRGKNSQMDYSVLRYRSLQCLPKQRWSLHYSTVRSSCHLLNAVGSSALSYFFKLFTHQNTNNSKQAEKAAWLQMVEGGDCFLPELNASSWAWFFSTWLQQGSSCVQIKIWKARTEESLVVWLGIYCC